MARTSDYRRSAVWRPCGVKLYAAPQNKSVVCSGSRVTNSTVMTLRGSDNRGGIIVKTYKEHLLTDERTHPCGTPIFTISSSDFVPQRLTLCGRSLGKCLIQRTRVWWALRSKGILTRCGWSGLKDEFLKSVQSQLSMIQTDHGGLRSDLMRIRHASSTPILALEANCRGSMRSATEATNWVHTVLSIHFARIDVKATGLKSFMFTFCFVGTGVNNNVAVISDVSDWQG